jgi:hypothetical protein
MTSQYYAELYRPTETKAQWRKMLLDLASVRAVILHRAKGEIVRLIAPIDISRAERDELHDLGARPF